MTSNTKTQESSKYFYYKRLNDPKTQITTNALLIWCTQNLHKPPIFIGEFGKLSLGKNRCGIKFCHISQGLQLDKSTIPIGFFHFLVVQMLICANCCKLVAVIDHCYNSVTATRELWEAISLFVCLFIRTSVFQIRKLA